MYMNIPIGLVLNHEKASAAAHWLVKRLFSIIVQECIGLMPNHEKANAATHWLVKRLPRGADKVLAAIGLGKNFFRTLHALLLFQLRQGLQISHFCFLCVDKPSAIIFVS
jgi:hypothetical protein